MTENEQIEEMTKVLNECCKRYDEHGRHLGNKCSECEYWCDTNYVCCSYNTKEARALYKAGYRKVERGEWIRKDDPILGAFYLCSACKCEWFTDGLISSENENNLNFCPNCGADMRTKN